MKKFGIGVLIILIVSGFGLQFFNTPKILADGTYANLGTSDAADGGADAINFSQGNVWTIDKYGKYILVTENRSGVHHFTWSNDLGTSWTQGSEATNFITRGSVAYDSINDKLHVIWTTNTCDGSGGIIYRRYGITRDGSHNITDITREDSGNINLQLDTAGSADCQEPVALWNNDGTTNGTLIALWGYMTTNQTEIRASMRHLSLSAADGVAGNWVALDGTADTFSSNAPNVAADKIYAVAATASVIPSAIIRGGSGARKNDLYVFAAASQTQNILAYRGVYNSGSHDWSGGWQAPVTVGQMNENSGYNAKHELITKPVLDSLNDRLYIGWPNYKAGGAGDTVSIGYLDSTDSPSSTIDVYSANGTHSYAPTLDIAFDQTLGQLYIAYVESTTNGDNGSIDYKTYDGSTLSGSTHFYTSPGGSAGADGGVDIPILYQNRSSNDRLLFAFRINGALPPTGVDPHTVVFGYITLAQPTSTPTPTPVSSGTSNSSSSSSSQQDFHCTNQAPTGTPDLFQVDVSDMQAKLYFAPAAGIYDRYVISFGYTPGDERFTVETQTGHSSGAIAYTLNQLTQNTTYYIKVRAGNGCQPGNWGNEMKVTTRRKGVTSGTRFFKNLLTQVLSIFPREITPVANRVTSTSGMCDYTVKSGDSLWGIAVSQLGDSRMYTDIIAHNKQSYPSLNTSSVIRKGWKLHLGC